MKSVICVAVLATIMRHGRTIVFY